MADHQVTINFQVYKLIPLGFCACGCGKPTKIAHKTNAKYGWVGGEPRQYLQGHNSKGKFREKHSNWQGGRYVDATGYPRIYMPDHPKAGENGYVHEHIILAEKALGKAIPKKVIVHHYTPDQLIICQDQGYHLLLHRRARALAACGHANWIKCPFCKEYDDPENMYVKPSGYGRHRECFNKFHLQWKKEKENVRH